MEGFGSIIMVVVWLIIVNLASRWFKKVFNSKGPDGTNTSKPTSSKPQQTFQDIFKEIQKKMEEAQGRENIPPYAQPERKVEVKPVTKQPPVFQKKAEINIQEVYKSKEVISKKEKENSAEYENFIREERKKEHDAESHALDKKIYALEKEVEEGVPFDLDLRNAIIGSIILERPYS
jgi:type IV secretory pathway VirB10-like protein